MYSGRQPAMTPLTAMLQTVAARLSGSRIPSTSSGLAVREAQERLDALERRWHDWQPVAPFLLVEMRVHVLERCR